MKTWIQVTNISIDLIEDVGNLFVWTTDLVKGGVINDARVVISKNKETEKPNLDKEKLSISNFNVNNSYGKISFY